MDDDFFIEELAYAKMVIVLIRNLRMDQEKVAYWDII